MEIKERVTLLEEASKRHDAAEAKIGEMAHFRTLAKVWGSVLGVCGVSIALFAAWVFQKAESALTKADAALKAAEAADARKDGILAELEAAVEAGRGRIWQNVDAGKSSLATQVDFAVLAGLRRISEASRASLPIGTVIPFAGPLAALPEGEWLLCDGRAMSSKAATDEQEGEYKPLFGVIATYWGDGKYNSDGTPTSGRFDFNLPDFRGQFLRGCNDSRVDRTLPPGQTRPLDPGIRTPYGSNPVTEVGTFEDWATGSPGGKPRIASVYTPQNLGSTYVYVTNVPSVNFVSTLTFDAESRPINLAVRFYIRAK